MAKKNAKNDRYATKDELFADLLVECEAEYEEQFGHVWSGIDDWGPGIDRDRFEFEERARRVYDQLAKAMEAARALVAEYKDAREAWFAECRATGREVRANDPVASFERVASVALGKTLPPDKVRSTTASHLAKWVAHVDTPPEKFAGDTSGLLTWDICRRPWIDTNRPVEGNLLVALHVLTISNFGIHWSAPDAPPSVAIKEKPSDRTAAIISLLHGVRPVVGVELREPKRKARAMVLSKQQTAMRNAVRRAGQRVLERLVAAFGVVNPGAEGEDFDQSRILDGAGTLESAMYAAIAFSKLSHVHDDIYRRAEEDDPAAWAAWLRDNPSAAENVRATRELLAATRIRYKQTP